MTSETMYQAEDDCESSGDTIPEGLSREFFSKWRQRFAIVALGCALTWFGLSLGLRCIVSRYPGLELDGPVVYIWIVPPFAALASFLAALVCDLLCCRGGQLLRHMGIILCNVIVMVAMYIYGPWAVSDPDGGGYTIAYGPIWSPPGPKCLMLDGVFFAAGRLFDQYMLVVIVVCSVIMLLARRSRPAILSGDTQ